MNFKWIIQKHFSSYRRCWYAGCVYLLYYTAIWYIATIHSNWVIIFVNPCKMCFNNESIKFALHIDANFIYAYPSSQHMHEENKNNMRGWELREWRGVCRLLGSFHFFHSIAFSNLFLSLPFYFTRTHFVWKPIIVIGSK